MNNPKIRITVKDMGSMIAELYPEKAPITVAHFLKLADDNFFEGLIFHRVIPGFMIQGGGYTPDMQHKEADAIKGEFRSNLFENNLKHDRGVLSMARTMNPNSAGSQFFIMVEKAPHLDGQYAAFGKVIEGMEVADAIVNTRTDHMDKPLADQRMKTVTVETFGEVYPEPVKA